MQKFAFIVLLAQATQPVLAYHGLIQLDVQFLAAGIEALGLLKRLAVDFILFLQLEVCCDEIFKVKNGFLLLHQGEEQIVFLRIIR